MKAIISVYDKTGLVDFGRQLHERGCQIVSTGGTFQTLHQAGIPVQAVSDLIGFPEILDGRVKTLHPRIHGGILARRDLPQHLAELADHDIEAIDMVVVNLYPFVETITSRSVDLEEALENIDIGGPTLLRAAAKNFQFVTVVVDPSDYSAVVEGIGSQGMTIKERRRLASKAFQHVAAYDATVAQYLAIGSAQTFPQELALGLQKLFDLRYGENPHQDGALYSFPTEQRGIAAALQLHGVELSYNNILDADTAWSAVCEFDEPTVAVIKHANPCGLASHASISEAYRRAYAGDPVSAFGGIVASNRPITVGLAQEINQIFYEVILAPSFQPEARELLTKKRRLRLLEMGSNIPITAPTVGYRRVSGGLLAQTEDLSADEPKDWKVVTKRIPSPQERADLAYGWKGIKYIKSNAIALVQSQALVGVGAGQPNRVTSVRLAVTTAGDRAEGSVLASDAFFPFADGVEAAGQAGVTAIIQPGGSIRDEEVIATADRLGMAMLFTGVRHFRH